MMEFLINHWRGCAVVFLPIIVIFTSSLILIKGLEAQILTRDEGPDYVGRVRVFRFQNIFYLL